MTRAPVLTLRVVSAGLLAAIAGIHLDLWAGNGYRYIPTIGPLFLLNGVAGCALALACLAAPRRFLVPVAASGALFAAGTLGALLISVNFGLFGFTESTTAPLLYQAVAVESAEILTGVLLAVTSWHGRRAPAGSR